VLISTEFERNKKCKRMSSIVSFSPHGSIHAVLNSRVPLTLLALDSFYKQFLASTEPEQYKSTSVFITSNTPYVKDLKQLTVHARTGTRRDCRLRKN
jgi:hypothetical protein